MRFAALIVLATGIPLLASSWEHLRHFDAFRAAVVAQQVVSYRQHRRASALFVAIEVGIGAASLAQVAVMSRTLTVSVGILQSATYAGLGVYLALILRSGRTAPCGCFGGSTEVSPMKLARVLILAMTASFSVLVALLPLW